MLYCLGVLIVLAARRPTPSPGQRLLVGVGAALALAAKEEWVALVPLVVIQDFLLFRLSPRAVLRRALPWALLAVAYLAVYARIARFAAGWFFLVEPTEVAAKFLHTLASFLHLVEPLPLHFQEAVSTNPVPAVAAVVLTFGMVAAAARLASPTAWFGFIAAGVTLLPSLPSSLQAARFTFLPWFFFLAGLAGLWAAACQRARLRWALTAAGAMTAVAVGSQGAVTVRGDLKDWAAHGALTLRLLAQAQPLLEAARRDEALVVLRGADNEPLASLARQPAGKPKLSFPRPDDPYGVVSLAALLTWRTWREGLAFERVPQLPAGTPFALFRHEREGFLRVPAASPPRTRFPGVDMEGLPGVILVPRPWHSFSPSSFP